MAGSRASRAKLVHELRRLERFLSFGLRLNVSFMWIAAEGIDNKEMEKSVVELESSKILRSDYTWMQKQLTSYCTLLAVIHIFEIALPKITCSPAHRFWIDSIWPAIRPLIWHRLGPDIRRICKAYRYSSTDLQTLMKSYNIWGTTRHTGFAWSSILTRTLVIAISLTKLLLALLPVHALFYAWAWATDILSRTLQPCDQWRKRMGVYRLIRVLNPIASQ